MIKNRSVQGVNAYQQLENDLRKVILRNELAYDKAITKEVELAKSYGISRNTARKALHNLVNAGLLRKVHGRGTFAVPPEERPQQKQTFEFIFAVDDYKNMLSTNAYDRNLMAGGLEQGLNGTSELRFLDPTNLDGNELTEQFQAGNLHGVAWERPQEKFYPMIEQLHNAGIPQVTISRRISGVPSIFFDIEYSMKEVMTFLFGIGHQEIAMLDLAKPQAIFKLKQKTFLNEMRKSGITDPEKYLSFFRHRQDNIEDVFNSLPAVTAIIIPSFAVEEFLIWCTGRFRIPEDLSLISLSSENSPELRHDVPVSAILEPRHDIGRLAVEMLEDMNRGKDISLVPVKMKGKLMISNTCISPEHLLNINNKR